MFRKKLFALSFALSVCLRIHWNMQDTADDSWLLLPLWCAWMAFLLPVSWMVLDIERGLFGFDPWNGLGHGAVTLGAMLLAAALYWFFPAARLARWFGTFDPFKGSDRPRPRILGAAVFLMEQTNRRLFGRQKTGGWA